MPRNPCSSNIAVASQSVAQPTALPPSRRRSSAGSFCLLTATHSPLPVSSGLPQLLNSTGSVVVVFLVVLSSHSVAILFLPASNITNKSLGSCSYINAHSPSLDPFLWAPNLLPIWHVLMQQMAYTKLLFFVSLTQRLGHKHEAYTRTTMSQGSVLSGHPPLPIVVFRYIGR